MEAAKGTVGSRLRRRNTPTTHMRMVSHGSWHCLIAMSQGCHMPG
jgi:hypothetical protein